MSFPCQRWAESMLAFKDGDLPEEEIEFLREHLDECAPCLALLRTYDDVLEVLARLRPVQVPQGLLGRLKTRLPRALRDELADDAGERDAAPGAWLR